VSARFVFLHPLATDARYWDPVGTMPAGEEPGMHVSAHT
jgi:hypothetical protein